MENSRSMYGRSNAPRQFRDWILQRPNLNATNSDYLLYVRIESMFVDRRVEMADVYAVFGTLIALAIAYPGLLLAWRTIFPDFVAKAQGRVLASGWATFGLGIAVGLPVIFVCSFLISIPAPILRFAGVILAILALTLASLGAAGLASVMGDRLNGMSGGRYSAPGAQVRGALTLELATVFPLIGWLLILPLGTLTCFGAGVFSLFSRRSGEIHQADQTLMPASEA
jgi:hypothetical protein